MNLNLNSLLKLRQAWNTFKGNHPKFPSFLNDINTRGIPEGSILEMNIKYPDGSRIKFNISVKPEDIDLLKILQDLR